MRISTTQMFNRGLNNIFSQQRVTSRLQEQIATGKRVLTPSDDPISAARIDLMKQRIQMTERYQTSRETAVNTLSLQESVLDNVKNNLHRVRDLQVQAGNGILTVNDKKIIAKEISTLLTELQGLANSRDESGGYLFSGGQSYTQAVSKNATGQYVYNGDDTIRHLDVSSSMRLALNQSGADLFMRIPNGNGQFSMSESLPANTGSLSLVGGTVVDHAARVEETNAINFVQNSSGQTVLMVTGTSSGNIIPPSGLPDDAPVFVEGQNILFNGLEIQTVGLPLPGDGFSVEPSVNESIFSTLQRTITNLNMDSRNSPDLARARMEHNRVLNQLDSALEAILVAQTDVGTRLSQADLANEINEDFILISRQSLTQIQEVDLAQVAVELNAQTVLLQAAQQSFTRIQGLSLFNYL